MPKIPISLQLYTVRDEAAKDFPGTLRQVAEIGYAAVELAGHGGLTTRALKSLLDDLHLSVSGSHVTLDTLQADMRQVVDDALTLGNSHVVIPSLPEEHRASPEAWAQTAETLSGLGETLQSFNLTLCYHNHDVELRPFESGELGLDILLAKTDPLWVKAEIDTYWLMVAGVDPVAYVRKHTGRVPLMHIKDRDPADGSFAEIGTGDMPLDALVQAADDIGTKYLVVEQDICRRPPLESVALSYANLKARGYA